MRVRALFAFVAASMLVASGPLTAGAVQRPAMPSRGQLYLVRLIEAGDIGLASPVGLAYAPDSKNLLITGVARDGGAVLRSITLFEGLIGAEPLPAGVPASASIAYDAAHAGLLGAATTGAVARLQTNKGQLVRGARSSSTALQGASASVAAAGIAVGVTGETLLLDAAGHVAVVADAAGTAQVTGTLSLSGQHEALRGLTAAPNGHVFSIGVASRTLYEFDAGGTLLVTRDLDELGVRSPQGLVIAPTADTSDTASLTSLYLADAGAPDGTGAGIYEIAFSEPPLSPVVALAADPPVSLARTIITGTGSALNPDSPDPSGLAYIPATETDIPAQRRDRLVIGDGEVEEITGAGWHDVNVWFVPRIGSIQTDTFDTTGSSPVNKEPVGTAYDPLRNELYFSKDGDNGNVWVYDAATMTQVRVFAANDAPYNNVDAEGLAFANGILYMLDAIDNDLVKVLPGGDGVIGTGDDSATNYDLTQYGQSEPEGVDVHPTTGNLWVVSNRTSDPMIEVTPTGQLVSSVSITFANPNSPAGVAIAPPSADGAGFNIYVAERGVDNNDVPSENDGKIYEFAVGASTPPGPDTTITGGPSGTVASFDATFTFTGTTGTTGFECQLDGGGYAACTSPQPYTGLSEATHTFDVRALAGTTPDPTPASRTWTISDDPPPPDTTITGGPSGTVSSFDATFTFTGSAGTTGFECQLDGGGFAACTSPQAYTGLSEATHSFAVRAVAGGITDPTPATRIWTISDDPPPPAGNLLLNAGFETDADGNGRPDDWTSKPKFTRSSEIAAHGGAFVGRHFATDNSNYTVRQEVDVTAGTQYAFDGYVNVPTTADAFTFEIKVRWYSGSDQLTTVKLLTVSAATAGWQALNASATPPTGATSAEVMMTVKSLNGTIYVDDLSFAAGLDTSITGGPSGTVSSTDATFTFTGSAGTTGFECQLDGGGYAACTSPRAYTGLSEATHSFAVRAVAGGTIDPTPATRVWTISDDPPPPAANLLLNAGFETDADGDGRPDDWTSKPKFTRSSEIAAHGGAFVGRHFADNNSGYSIVQDVNVTAGTQYAFDGFVNVPATGDAFTFDIKVRWYSGSDRLNTVKLLTMNAATAGWQALNASSATAPAGATSAEVMMTVKSLNGTIYVDDLSFTAGTAP